MTFPRKKHPYTFKHIVFHHLSGAIIVWFLILMSPVLGLFIIYFIPIAWIKDLLFNLNVDFWTPIWEKLGYFFNVNQAAPFCASNQDPVSTILVCALYGAGIGIVGASFQTLSMKRYFGAVRERTIHILQLTWGLIFLALNIGLLEISWADNGGGCYAFFNSQNLIGYLVSFILMSAVAGIIFVIPLMIGLGLAFRITFHCWQSEMDYWILDVTSMSDTVVN